MAEKIKENLPLTFGVGIGLVLAIIGIVMIAGMMSAPKDAWALATTVTVTATVSEWLTFTSDQTAVALTPNLVDTAGNTAIGSSTDINLVVGTNDGGGYSITVSSANEGLASSSNYIYTVNGSSTIAAGTDGYGLNATSVLGTINANYTAWGTTEVGEATTTAATITTYGSSITAGTTTVKIYAAADALQAAAVYEDTLTFTATGQT